MVNAPVFVNLKGAENGCCGPNGAFACTERLGRRRKPNAISDATMEHASATRHNETRAVAGAQASGYLNRDAGGDVSELGTIGPEHLYGVRVVWIGRLPVKGQLFARLTEGDDSLAAGPVVVLVRHAGDLRIERRVPGSRRRIEVREADLTGDGRPIFRGESEGAVLTRRKATRKAVVGHHGR